MLSACATGRPPERQRLEDHCRSSAKFGRTKKKFKTRYIDLTAEDATKAKEELKVEQGRRFDACVAKLLASAADAEGGR